ncbi:MAG TPA: amino acid adenylation domain-containing protein [Bacillota bacterium]|nr:amino acid adenylation domain-containing protein [Bacillota bacterium]
MSEQVADTTVQPNYVDFEKEKQYWFGKFAGEIVKSYFPYDEFKAEMAPQLESMPFQLSGDVYAQLLKLSNRSDFRLHMILVAAVVALLYKYTGNSDVTVGMPIYKQAIAGQYINTVLPIRNDLAAGMSFKDLLLKVHQNISAAVEHQNYPVERLLQHLNLPFSRNEFPLFDTFVLLENIHDPGYIETVKVNTVFHFRVTEGALEARLDYHSGRYRKETIGRIVAHLQNLLPQLLKEVNRPLVDVEIILETEKARILAEFNHKAVQYPHDKTIHELFEAQVQKNPQKTAVAFPQADMENSPPEASESLTYEELNRRANQLARKLLANGIKPDCLVGIMAERSLEMFIGVMAILKAGGAYVPIDPSYPDSRIRFMIDDSQITTLLIQEPLQGRIQFGGQLIIIDNENSYQGDDSNLGNTSGPDNLAYLIYTSGSTGKPKGVMIEHRGMMNALTHFRLGFGVKESDRVIQFASFSFDASVSEIVMSLLLGGTLYLAPNQIINNFRLFEDFLAKHQITVATLPPSYLTNLEPKRVASLRTIIAAGSASNANLVNKWNNTAEYINAYGPTEASICASFWKPGAGKFTDDLVPIGRPINNTQIYIIDSNLKLQPIGIPGEICIAGAGLARGYWERPELTAEKFVVRSFRESPPVEGPPPQEGQPQRIYRTGDLGRWMADGNIEFLGRMDHQVKIRGFRIETGEIEFHLSKHPKIKEVLVTAEVDESGNGYLCAYFTAAEELNGRELTQLLGLELPDYMIPNYLIQVEQFPLTPNGKIDRKALPQPAGMSPKTEFVAPQNELQRKLLKVWQDVLGVAEIGINTDFFALGGDSIKAIQISARLLDEGLKLESKDLFGYRNIQEISKFVKPTEIAIDQQQVAGEMPLSPVQCWFFEQNFTDMHHFNQPILLFCKDGFDETIVRNLFTELLVHHDTLRIGFQRQTNGITQVYRDTAADHLFTLEVFDLQALADVAEKIAKISNRIQAGLDLFSGPLIKMGLFKCNGGDHLLIVVHHLLIDTVSWRILFEDIQNGYFQAIRGQKVSFPQKTHSYKEWVNRLFAYANSPELLIEISYWKGLEQTAVKKLPKDNSASNRRLENNNILQLVFTEAETEKLLKEANRAYNTEINDILLTALGLAIKGWTGENQILIHLESHGREEIFKDLVINRTIGWFTASFPVILNMEHSHNLSYLIKTVKENLRHIPKKGIGYGILQYLTAPANRNSLQFNLKPEIAFNYLGQFDQEQASHSLSISGLSTGMAMSPKMERWVGFEINGMIADAKLKLFFNYDKDEYHEDTVNQFMKLYRDSLWSIIQHCLEKDNVEQTPSDLGDKTLSLEELDDISELLSN